MKIYPFLIGEPSINGPFSMISMAMLVITRWYHWDPDVNSGDFRTGSDAGARFVRPSLGMSWLSVRPILDHFYSQTSLQRNHNVLLYN